MVVALITLLLAGIAWLIFQWKKGNKKFAVTIWIIIGIWLVGSIVYDEMRKYSRSSNQSRAANKIGFTDDTGGNKDSSRISTLPEAQKAPLILDHIDPLYTVANSRTKSSTRGEYIETFSRLVPDWRVIKDLPQFSQFLASKFNKPNPFDNIFPNTQKNVDTMPTYRALLSEADNNIDPVRAAQIYNTFKREYGMR
jgi:hypothetical protein